MKLLSDYLDSNGWPGHWRKLEDRTLEFGDGSLRLGQLKASEFILAETSEEKEKVRIDFSRKAALLLNPGEPIRYPDPNEFYGQPGTMSRDALWGLITGAYVVKNNVVLAVLQTKLLRRWGFAWNTKGIWDGWKLPIPDWCGPDVWRILDPKMSYEGMLFCDFFAILKSLFVAATYPLFRGHTSPIQVMSVAILARRINPTSFSEVADYIFMNWIDWRRALREYFEDPKAPPLDVILIKALENK